MIHLGRRRQVVREELVHNAAPGILLVSNSPPCYFRATLGVKEALQSSKFST